MKHPNHIFPEEVEIGMVVSLRSGGPTMALEKFENGCATCVWFDRREELNTRSFPIELLQRGASRAVMIVPAGLVPADVAWEREMREAGVWDE